ncbi:MAG TPA: dienelactone hydrolase family protein, partial [Myxococcota bacterium]|nr:dienelactone hydrolase family protein [Myxococcota bacterium]
MRRIFWLLVALAACDQKKSPPPPSVPPQTLPTGMSEEQFADLHTLRPDEPSRLTGKDVLVGGSRAYLSLPANAAPGMPAVIVIHEWWGLNDHIRHAADRLAGLGMAALAVDLYGGNVASTREQAQTYVKSVDPKIATAT